MPPDACVEGLIMSGQQFPIVIDGETIQPVGRPTYLIIRNGELAEVGAGTGRFMIGEKQKETWRFLIDQVGEDKMVLLPDELYEEEWGPYRQKALDEGC